jgi:hypothetical protein
MADAQEQKRIAEKQLRRARRMTVLSAFALAVSLLAIVASAVPEWAPLVGFLMWNHIAVIVVFGTGAWAARRLAPAPVGRVSPRLGELLAPWMLVLALVTAVAAIPNWGPTPWWDLGLTTDGSTVTPHPSQSDGGRFFERINHGPGREITEADVDRLNQDSFGLFARLWAFLSLGGLVTWRFIALRRRDLLQGDPPLAAATVPRQSTTAPGAVTGADWQSTALIIGLWVAFIGLNVLSLTSGPHRVFCSLPVPIPPEMRLFMLVMPVLIIGLGSFWTKRSPFMSPWLASLIDQRLGAGGTIAFIARLRPLLLFSVTSFFGAGALLSACAQGGAAPIDWTMPGFLASTGVALAISHVILRRRGIPGV